MTINGTRNILIADDHYVVRQGVELILTDILDTINIFHASTLNEVKQSLKKFDFFLIVLDAVFPDGHTINEVTAIRKEYPDTKILIYSGLEEHIFGLKFIELGVDGFLSKLATETEISTAFQTLLRNKIYLSEKLKTQQIRYENNISQNPFSKLSEREFQIMVNLIQGKGNLEICNIFDLKPTTVTTYKNRIFDKLSIQNLSELITLYQLHYQA